MNTFNNKKGFTLVELLAVIVVLAIISVIAMRAIGPVFQNSAKDSFAIEANEAISAASDAISLTYINAIKDGYYVNGNNYCFTLAQLVKLGVYTKDLNGYEGYVTAEKNSGDYAYKYKVYMHSKDYKLTSAVEKADSKSNIDVYVSGGSWGCPSGYELKRAGT